MLAPIFSRGSPMGDFISGQKAPLGRILRNFRLCMRTLKGTPKRSRDLRSLPVAMVLKKARGKAGHAQNILPITSGSTTSHHLRKCDFGCPYILLLTKVSPHSDICELGQFWLPCLGPLGFLILKTFKLFGFQIFWL
jgi:hypothetical protein